MPFYLLPGLGGHNTLRGYADYRFHDRHLLAGTIESPVYAILEMNRRLDELRENGLEMTGELDVAELSQHLDPNSLDFEVRWGASDNLHSTLHIPVAPELPAGLSPGQAAQLSEMIEYLHLRSRTLVDSVAIPEGESKFTITVEQWQCILDLQSQLGEYLRKVGEPGSR